MSKVKVILFWLISCTWGAIMTSIGAVVALVLICTGHRPHRFRHLIYFEVGYGWGGVELGAFFVVSRGATLPPYGSIWFEGWASRLGEKYFN